MGLFRFGGVRRGRKDHAEIAERSRGQREGGKSSARRGEEFSAKARRGAKNAKRDEGGVELGEGAARVVLVQCHMGMRTWASHTATCACPRSIKKKFTAEARRTPRGEDTLPFSAYSVSPR